MTATKAPKKAASGPVARGPKPETLKIKGKWQDAVKKSLSKKKPDEGWPK